jgi:putative multiple sugar transport system substrate-binding protein
MDNLLSGFYADKHLDAVLVAADCLAIGVISSLESMGYGTGDVAFPLITGQDAELAAVKSIKAGKQSMTAFLDANELVKIIVPVTTGLLNGEAPAATATYNNGAVDVPAQTYSPYAITAENVDYLVEVGFYTDADING